MIKKTEAFASQSGRGFLGRRSFSLIPGLYFKSFSRFTESRIPFEILSLASVIRQWQNSYVSIADFNSLGESRDIDGSGSIHFPNLPLDGRFYEGSANYLSAKTPSEAYFFVISIHTNGNFFHAVKMAESLARKTGSLIIF